MMKKILVLVVVCIVGAYLLVAEVPKKNDLPVPASPSLFSHPAFSIIKLDAGTFTPSVEYNAMPLRVSEWAGSGSDVIINGGYFNEDYTPSGLLVVDGGRIGARHFDYNKSAVLAIRDGVMSIFTPKSTAELASYTYVVQSFPLLIDKGRNIASTIPQQKARRSAIGLDRAGNAYAIVSDTSDLTLHDFAEKIIANCPACTEVLNLDGGPSTGLYSTGDDAHDDILIDSWVPVPSVIRFIKK